jgi:uncharacterized protein YecE (DUF72 family)
MRVEQRSSGGVWIGTSGWVYKHWAQSFYPHDWPKKHQFLFYVRHFPTVEINATFYRLPTRKMVKGWHDKAPDGFLFAVKGSRFITHIKRLAVRKSSLKKYFNRIAPLQERCGPILWQLPPNFQNKPENMERVRVFLSRLPKQYRHALEFRHPSWHLGEVNDLLKQFNVANVWLSSLRMPMDFAVTADFIYVRFHGLEHGAAHDYTEADLKPWAVQLRKVAKSGKPSFVYFNNDLNTRAPLNARMLMRMVGRHAIEPFETDEPIPSTRRFSVGTRAVFDQPLWYEPFDLAHSRRIGYAEFWR